MVNCFYTEIIGMNGSYTEVNGSSQFKERMYLSVLICANLFSCTYSVITVCPSLVLIK